MFDKRILGTDSIPGGIQLSGRMSRWLAIAAYRCRIDGTLNGSVDFQVRYFDLPAASDVEEALRNEPPHEYESPLGERVSWSLARIFEIRCMLAMASGDEIVGFTATAEELSSLGRADSD